MSSELTALGLAKVIAKRAAESWLSQKRRGQEQNLDLNDLIRVRVPGLFAQRSVERQFDQIADSIAARLEVMITHEFHGMQINDKNAALAQVVSAFTNSNLSDTSILAADADTERLYQEILENNPPDQYLGEAAQSFYKIVLRECCSCYLKVIRNLPPFTERAVTELLRRTTDLLGEISKIVERLPPPTLFDARSAHADDEFERVYIGLVASELDEVELFTLIPGSTLRSRLSMAYIGLSVATRDYQSESLKASRILSAIRGSGIGTPGAEYLSVSASSALSRSQRTLVRGEAGSGKTTLLRWLAVSAAQRSFEAELEEWNGVIPFLVKLRNYSGKDLPEPKQFVGGLSSVIAGMMPAGWVERILRDGRGLILIDGVDELAENDRDAVHAWIRQISRVFPNNRMVVTSRPAVVSSSWLHRIGFKSVAIEPMNPRQQGAFISHWYAAVQTSELPCEPEELPGYESSLIAALADRSELRALAETPLLAAMLCALHLYRRRQLPRNRMELYKMAIEILLQRDDDRDVPSAKRVVLNLADKVYILSDLAWRLSDNHLNELEISRAARYVEVRIATMPSVIATGNEVLSFLLERSGLLREPSAGRVDFIHRTFQEYFAAMECAAEDRIGNLVSRCTSPQWRETIVMAAGHCNRVQRIELITGIHSQVKNDNRDSRSLRMLVISCIETMTSVPDELSAMVDDCFSRLIPPRDKSEATLLAQGGHSVLARLPISLKKLSRAEGESTIRTAALVGGNHALNFLSGISSSASSYWSASALLAEWDYFDANEYAFHVLSKIKLDGHVVRIGNVRQLSALPRAGKIDRLEIRRAVVFADSFLKDITASTLRELRVDNYGGQADLEKFALLDSLEILVISGGGTLPDHLEFPSFPRMRQLALSGWSSLPDFSRVKFPPKLESLRLGVFRGGFDCRSLSSCNRLELLAVEIHGDMDYLQALQDFSLKRLEIIGRGVALDPNTGVVTRNLQFNSLQHVSTLKSVRSLKLRGLNGEISLAPIAELPLLDSLDVGETREVLDLAPFSGRKNIKIFISRGQSVRGAGALTGGALQMR
jgi:hypothetical protein